jgi:hypothetical protein
VNQRGPRQSGGTFGRDFLKSKPAGHRIGQFSDRSIHFLELRFEGFLMLRSGDETSPEKLIADLGKYSLKIFMVDVPRKLSGPQCGGQLP